MNEYITVVKEIENILPLLPEEQKSKIDILQMQLTPDCFEEIRVLLTKAADSLPIESDIKKEDVKSIYRAAAKVSVFLCFLKARSCQKWPNRKPLQSSA